MKQHVKFSPDMYPIYRKWHKFLEIMAIWIRSLAQVLARFVGYFTQYNVSKWVHYLSKVLVVILVLGLIHACNPHISQSTPLIENSTSHEAQSIQTTSPHHWHSENPNTPIDLAQGEPQRTEVPVNTYLANSPWPIFHRNNYAQASTPLRGPEPGNSIEVDFIDNTAIGGTSPWSQLSERYPDGERVVWGATNTHLFKAKADQGSFEIIDTYRIDRNPFSLHWNLLVLAGNKVIVPDTIRRRIYKFADRNPNDWRSDIILEDTFNFPRSVRGRAAQINITYDGWIIFMTGTGDVVAVSNDFEQYRTLQLPKQDGEINFHNAFSLDETGGIYIVTTHRFLKVGWRNNQLSLDWDVPYDFRGPGCDNVDRNVLQEIVAVARGETCTGSGTTPTLMGTGSNDRLVLVADGHSPANRMVAFWRDTIPADWSGIPGYDRRIAAITPLPYSTPDGEGFTAENSPTVDGYDITIAQYNGFSPGCNPLRGVQKLHWNSSGRSLDVVWATDEVNFNNVLTYSRGSNLVYGTGRRECIYYLWGLDWDTGQVLLELPLGDSPNYLNQGTQITISDNQTIFFGSSTGLVRIKPH